MLSTKTMIGQAGCWILDTECWILDVERSACPGLFGEIPPVRITVRLIEKYL